MFNLPQQTGTDLKLAKDAVAAVTLGKDMTLRDYSQACYRMRGLAKVLIYATLHIHMLQKYTQTHVHIEHKCTRDMYM